MSYPGVMADATTIRCPACEGTCHVLAPSDACVFFHECECCGVMLRPDEGDCCVICSYGHELCPPRQVEAN